jgi:F-type H+-transporting ATPase subunit b
LVAGLHFNNARKTKKIMVLLANSLTSPAIGTIFWSVVIFLMFLFILTRFAWKPVLGAIRAREEMIKGSLESAEQAREEMKKLQSDNEIILRKAREERELILREARDVRDKLISEAKGRASEEAEKLVEKARTGIEAEKRKAMAEFQEQVANLSVEIASRLMGERLSLSGEQAKLIDNYMKDINFSKN